MTAEEMAAEGEARVWGNLFLDRVGHWSCNRERAEAELLAWSDLENRWHMAYGERVPHDRCAGCRKALGTGEIGELADGNMVHVADGYDCLIQHGERWRKVASDALRAMGVSNV